MSARTRQVGDDSALRACCDRHDLRRRESARGAEEASQVDVLPKGFHRIRHYGLLANGNRAANIAKARELLAMPAPVKAPEPDNDEPCVLPRPRPCCGGRMLIIETFARGATPRRKATPMPPVIRIDTS